MRKMSLSTGDLARYCQVTPATIVNWIRAGKLEVYTTPGGQYRMEQNRFLDFLRANNFPIPEELQDDRVRRVLIIDDDPDILEMLVEVVTGLGPGFKVAGEKNGYDGLIKVGDFKPDVISLDLMMPKMDGAEVCRRLRSNAETKNIRVLVVSGLNPSADLVRKVKRIGVDAYLTKPIGLEEYSQLVRKLASQG